MEDDARRRRREIAYLYGSMERIPFSMPTPPFTLHPSGRRILPYYPDCFDSVDGELYPDGGRAIELLPGSPWMDARTADLSPAASPSRHRAPEGGRRRRHRSVDSAASRHGDHDLDGGGGRRSIDSLYAGAAHHIAAAARYMEAAERRRRARASEDGAGRDPELGLSSSSSSSDAASIVSANGNSGDDMIDALCGLLDCICGGGDGDGGGLLGTLGGLLLGLCGGGDGLLETIFGLLFGMCGGGGGDRAGGEDNDNDDVPQRLYELVYIVLALVLPYVLYKVLPGDVVRGDDAHAWTWFLIFYAIVITAATTIVSVRALSSRCCSSRCLRILVFAVSVAAEILGYLQVIPVIPDTSLGRGGALFSLAHLVVIYLLAWTPICRRLSR